VKSGEVFSLPIVFRPNWICAVEARLELINVASFARSEYLLKGFGEEPTCEEHFELETSTSTACLCKLVVPNN